MKMRCEVCEEENTTVTSYFTDPVKTKKLTGHRTRLANSHRFRQFFTGHRSGGWLPKFSPVWVVGRSLVTGVGSRSVTCHRSGQPVSQC